MVTKKGPELTSHHRHMEVALLHEQFILKNNLKASQASSTYFHTEQMQRQKKKKKVLKRVGKIDSYSIINNALGVSTNS